MVMILSYLYHGNPLPGKTVIKLKLGPCFPSVLPVQWLLCVAASVSWWRHQMETFSALLALHVGNSLVTGEFPSQRPVMWSFDVFFDLCLNKWLSKQSRGWWFEMPSRPLWCHCNDTYNAVCRQLGCALFCCGYNNFLLIHVTHMPSSLILICITAVNS